MNLRDHITKSEPLNICACMGPQNGQPLCPCAMRGVIVRDGRYIVPERDIGPARPQSSLSPPSTTQSARVEVE